MAKETLLGDDGEPIMSDLEVSRADGALYCLIAKLFGHIAWELFAGGYARNPVTRMLLGLASGTSI